MSNASDIGIYQLKINIRSNIPNQEKFVLTSDMLNYTGGASLEKYPFFSAVHTYPRRKLQGKSYNEIVEFFFILSNFRTKLRKQNITRRDKTNIPKNKTQNAKQGGVAKQGEVAKQGGASEKTPQEKLILKQSNFILMLQLLFPTVYPIINNIDTSIGIISEQTDELETKDENAGETEEITVEESEVFDDAKKSSNTAENKQAASTATSVFDFKNISSFFSLKGTSDFFKKFGKKFSYLKLGGQEYTITRTIWLNDVMNNPIYSDIIKTYQIFTIWKSSKQEIHDKKEKWNIVLLLFDYCVKLKSRLEDRLERMNLLDSYTRIEQNNIATFNNQVKTINDLLKSEYSELFNFIAEDISKEPAKYTEQRKKVFEKYKADDDSKLYDELEKLSNSYKQIQNQNVTNTYNAFLRDLNEKIKYYSQIKKYDAYVNNLNFEYLSEEKQKIDSSLIDAARNISTSYPEFNNFVSKIRDMKVRVIDNPVWKKVIESIILGKKYHNFESKIWKKIDSCYGLSEDYEEQMNDEDDPNDGLTDEPKKMTGGGCSMSEMVMQVNFDEIRDQDSSKMANMKLIDLYLQMDVIEGKIDESNVQLIKCDYTNTELGNTWDTLMNGNMSWDLSQIMTFYSAKKQLASGIAASTNTNTTVKS
jgi:hypothetical protein